MVVQAWSPSTRKLRLEKHKFEASLGYTVKSCLKEGSGGGQWGVGHVYGKNMEVQVRFNQNQGYIKNIQKLGGG